MKGYDYSGAGAYFVTICTAGKELYFDNPDARAIVRSIWNTIPLHDPAVGLDEFVVMPNHVHGIVWLLGPRRGRMYPAPNLAGMYPAPTSNVTPGGNRENAEGAMHGAPTTANRTSLFVVIQNFKAAVTRKIRHQTQTYFAWQRNYYERVIRNRDELCRIRQYIHDNPLNWEMDEENPSRKKSCGGREND